MKTPIYFLFIAILLAAAAASASTVSQPEIAGDMVSLEEVEGGSLLTRTKQDPVRYIPLPELRTDVQISVTGVAAHVEVNQTFKNPSTQWLEAIYVFPLPENSAVTRLRMRVADRIIEGVVKEKNQARKQYVKAKKQGKKASLVEQQRPNLFTSSIANIPPGESISITLSYSQTVSRAGDDYSLRVPLVAGPRYLPPTDSMEQNDSNDVVTIGADDPGLKNPNTIPPEFGKINPVSLRFELDAGFELGPVSSSYHDIDTVRIDQSRIAGNLIGRHFADRDFELRWQPVSGITPQLAMFVTEEADKSYVLLMLQPPLPDTSVSSVPRELIVIIDASGSMHGDSIAQALTAARFALSTLGAGDRFNLIHFSDTPTMLFPSPQGADATALAQAELFLSRVQAQGGTNMATALRRAFDNPQAPDTLRQIVFLTDGAVGNEAALFAMIARGTQNSRLFTVGIGSAPNGYFMRRAARVGRGTFTFIGGTGEVASKMSALFEQIGKPALTGIRIDWHGSSTEEGSGRVPDLYYGEPLTITARISTFNGLTATGHYAGRAWRHEIGENAPRPAPWVSKLWARNRIAQLKDDLLGGGDREQVKRQIMQIGMEHQLVTPYTSLVAVEHRVSRNESETLHRSDVPANLPHGWSYRHVFGSLPQTALGWRLEFAAGLMLILLCLVVMWLVRARRLFPASS